MKNTIKMLLAGAMAVITALSVSACATVTEITDNESNDAASSLNIPYNASVGTINEEECTREEFIEYMPGNVYIPEIPEGYTATYKCGDTCGYIYLIHELSYDFVLSIQPRQIQYPVIFTTEKKKESSYIDPDTGMKIRTRIYVCEWERSTAAYSLLGYGPWVDSEAENEFLTLGHNLCAEFSEGDTGVKCSREELKTYMSENIYIPEIPDGYTAEYIYNNQTKNGYIYIKFGQTYDLAILITPCENENPKTEPYEEIEHNVQSENTPYAVIIGKWENNHASYLQIGKFVVQDGKDDDVYIAIFRNLLQQFATNN